ncbi:MAG: restriction endonuclease [Candidatus Microsaccharimonas sp.]
MPRRRIYKSRKQASPNEAVFIISLIIVCLIGIVIFQTSIELRYTIILLVISVLFLILGVSIALVSYKKKREAALARALAISQIDTLTGIEFENYLAHIFRHKGYKVQDTPRSNDFGVDLLITKKVRRRLFNLNAIVNQLIRRRLGKWLQGASCTTTKQAVQWW